MTDSIMRCVTGGRYGLVYLDAYVPDNGESLWSLTTQNYRERFIGGVAVDGLNCAAPGHLDRLDCAHDIPRLAPEALAEILLGGPLGAVTAPEAP